MSGIFYVGERSGVEEFVKLKSNSHTDGFKSGRSWQEMERESCEMNKELGEN